MTPLLHRTGAACAAHPWRTVATWLLILIGAIGAAAGLGGTPHDDYDVPGTASQAATERLRAEFPEVSGDEARVVLHARTGRIDAGVADRVRDAVDALPGVGSVDARWSADRATVLLSARYDVPVTSFEGTEATDALREAAAPATDGGLQVELGGLVAEDVDAGGGHHELVGLGVALVVLLVAFGSVLAAGVPLLVALFGLGVGSCLVTLAASWTDVSTAAPMVAAMVGLGVGIDYAMLLSTRFAEVLRTGVGAVEAAGRATAEAGRAVVFAGCTVLVSLLGLGLGGLPVFTSFGLATAVVVLCVVAASLTLVPALCGLAGRRLLGRRGRDLPARDREPLSARWAAVVVRRPVALGGAALLVLLTLSAPVLAMRTWPQDAGAQPSSMTTRRAHDLVAEAFGPGANAPMVVVVDLVGDPGAAARVRSDLAADEGVAAVTPPRVSASGRSAVMLVEPTTAPADRASAALVHRLRSDVLGDRAGLTGTTAAFSDISDRLDQRLWLVVAFVVGTSMLLLVAMFRSLLVAVKAAAMNLLSVGAAYGVLTAVFQWGWGAGLLGLPHATAVSTWVPILLFAVLFGLSMDYEVFLLSRIRSAWLRTGDTRASVVEGIGATGRVITSAALIMIAVFAAFGLGSDVVVKMIGLGMAVAIAVDATLVRMLLLPATMSLLGEANWWLPRWLDRLLPRLEPHDAPAADAVRAPEPVGAGR